MHLLHLYIVIHTAYFFEKIVRIASENSSVKVPDLQPAWMIYLSQNEAQVSEVESCSTNESFFK